MLISESSTSLPEHPLLLLQNELGQGNSRELCPSQWVTQFQDGVCILSSVGHVRGELPDHTHMCEREYVYVCVCVYALGSMLPLEVLASA